MYKGWWAMELLRDRRGYTLVETIIAVTLLCLMFAAVYNTCLNGISFWKRNGNRLEVQDNLTISMDRITRELRQAKELSASSTSRQLYFKDVTGSYVISYYLEGTTLKRRQSIGDPIASYVTAVNFQYLPWGTGDTGRITENRVVGITLTGEKGNSGPVTLSSTVRLRAAR